MYLQLPPPPMNKSLIILESHCLSQTSINHDQFNEQKRLIESFVYSEQTQPFLKALIPSSLFKNQLEL